MKTDLYDALTLEIERADALAGHLEDRLSDMTDGVENRELTVRQGDYRKEFTGSYTHPAGLAYYGGAWRECSKTLAKNLKVWLAANHDRLLVTTQLMRGAQRAENKNLEVADISRSLKMIAKDLDVPVLLLSQLSRAPAQRADRRPQLSDLRDSGAIEQDADVVLLLYRDPSEKGVAEINVAKHRNGPTATVKAAFVEDLMRFENLEPIHRDAEVRSRPNPDRDRPNASADGSIWSSTLDRAAPETAFERVPDDERL